MKINMDTEFVPLSFAKYTVCYVTLDSKDYDTKRIREERFKYIDELMQKVSAIVQEKLGSKEVELSYSMSSNSIMSFLCFRRKNYMEEAEQYLIERGMTQEDILDGKDMMFTDHTGLFVKKENNGS